MAPVTDVFLIVPLFTSLSSSRNLYRVVAAAIPCCIGALMLVKVRIGLNRAIIPVTMAATDPKLVPYGAMTATFYTGVGCLLGPSILYFIVSAIF